MAEMESAHGKLSSVDQKWTAPRFLGLLTATLLAALAIIYTIASVRPSGTDFSWHPFAHDLVKHTVESSTM
jgi:hypothetical protein